jgi:hypothetical protein
MTHEDLVAIVADLTPAQWRSILLAAADQRCIACGSDCDCDCSDEVDAAKGLVAERAIALEETDS